MFIDNPDKPRVKAVVRKKNAGIRVLAWDIARIMTDKPIVRLEVEKDGSRETIDSDAIITTPFTLYVYGEDDHLLVKYTVEFTGG